jgi:putative transposase
MRSAYKFRLYPNQHQEAVLGVILETCRHLYNEALAAKKEAWEDDHTQRFLCRYEQTSCVQPKT